MALGKSFSFHFIFIALTLVTFQIRSFYPKNYQEEFCRDIFYAANVFYNTLEGHPLRQRKSIEEEQLINESAKCRIIGITLETRPDHITITEIKRLRKYGCTRVQLGIQHTDNKLLKKVNRDHTVEQSAKGIKLLKENGFKVDGHFMPDLPGSTPEMDKAMFYRVLNGEDLQVDYMKIYPCTITPFTEIKKWYELPDSDPNKYKPYAETDVGRPLINLIKHVKSWMKPWIRLNRIYRDFPNQNIKKGEIGAIGGIMLTNLRQIVKLEMDKDGLICKCIRCREVKGGSFNWDSAQVFIRTYRASGGIEYFISVESRDQHILYGFVRLRFNDPNFNKRLKVLNDIECETGSAALIRELHVYGSLVKVDAKKTNASQPFVSQPFVSQHFGIGKRLLREAERIAKDAGYRKISVISGVGVRGYYRKLGYHNDAQGYLTKGLTDIKSLSQFNLIRFLFGIMIGLTLLVIMK